MNDWQRVLQEVLDEKEKAEKVAQPKGRKKNRGRGAYSLQRPQLTVRSKPIELNDEPDVHNWRRSPMER